MKSSNIAKKLEKMGYEVDYKKFGYWDNILHCKGTAIASYAGTGNTISINTEFTFDEVLSKIGKYSDMSGRYDLEGNPQEEYWQ